MTKKKEARFEPSVCRGQFYKIRVLMVRWLIRFELRLVASRKDEQDRAADHRSLEDVVVECPWHGSVWDCVYVSLPNEDLKCLQSCDPADTEHVHYFARSCSPIGSNFV